MVNPSDDAADRTKPLISVKDICLSYGNFRALTDVSVDFYPGELVGLVGDNGAGKTSLIRHHRSRFGRGLFRWSEDHPVLPEAGHCPWSGIDPANDRIMR
jgi:ABC-type uncharacterized transport system ATPase subunit